MKNFLKNWTVWIPVIFGARGADGKWDVPVNRVAGEVIHKCSPMRSPEIYT